jgi:copper transport protein
MLKRTLFLAPLCSLLLSAALSAQYAGWTIPDGGKDEKSPLKSSADLVQKGKSLFGTHCQKCHGPLGKGDGPDSDKNSPAADLTDEFRTELNPEGVLYYKIMNGHPPAMPAFKSKLTKNDAWTLVEYLKTLRVHP